MFESISRRRFNDKARFAWFAPLALISFGGAARGANAVGLDVYAGNRIMNWTKIAATGDSFAFVKATQGTTYEDTNLSYNEANGTAAGMYIGAYDFAEPTKDTPAREAAYFVSYASQSQAFSTGHLVPVLDLETGGGQTVDGAASLTAWADTWCADVYAATGVHPIIYTGTDFASDYLTSAITTNKLWIASPSYNPTTNPNVILPWSQWTFWQYGQGTVNGDPASVADLDQYNGTIASLISNEVITASQPVVPHGDSLDWDPGQTSPSPTGGSGTLNATASSFYDTTIGATSVWQPGADLHLTAGTGTITVSGALSAQSITFKNTGVIYTLTGGTLNIGTGGIIDNVSGKTESISSTLAGGDINISGTTSNILELDGANSFTGNLNIQNTGAGIFRIDVDNQSSIPSTATINIESGGSIAFGNQGLPFAGNETFANNIQLNLNAGSISDDAYIFSSAGRSIYINGVISGTGNVSYSQSGTSGVGTVVLNNHNTYAGYSDIGGSTVQLGIAHALPDTALEFGARNSGGSAAGTLDLNGFNQTVSSLSSLVASNSSGGITNSSTSPSTLTIDGDATTSFGLAINGAVALSVNPAGDGGNLTLSGNNSYTAGTTITGGTLAVGSSTALGAIYGTLTVGGGVNVATLSLGSNAIVVGASYLRGSGTISGVAGSSLTASSLSITGSGNQIASGSVATTGGTTIGSTDGNTSGDLVVNGALGGTVNVYTGELSGTGNVTGPVTTHGGSIISPGDDGVVGTLSFTGGLALGPSDELKFDLSNSGTNQGGTTNDLIATASLDLSNAGTDTVAFDFLGTGTAAPVLDQAYALITYISLTGNPMLFQTTGVPAGDVANFSATGNAIDVTFTAVPEPAAIGLLLIGGGSLLIRRPRRV